MLASVARRLLFLVLMLVGCSSEPSSSGGAGGQPRACTPGSTQECVGPGACKGGQSCAFDGSGWSPCECGGGGSSQAGSGGSGQAGSGGSGQAGSFPSSGAGGSDAGAGGSDAGSGGSAAGAGGSTGSGDAGAGGSTAGTAGGGAAGNGGSAGGGSCQELPGDECQACCNKKHPGVQQDFATDLVGCACFDGCVAECTDICNGAESGVVCNACLNEKFKGGQCGLDSCASASCKAFSACVLGCP